ncbi:MAG: ExeM/NucH family extracellular endonuclease [Nocardioides sp.]|uniref:ExeM/NucH family extracellular endonuclease n=1 Tax=Nocardioides sp. TaxID=35761 RepID=UPI003F0DCCF2
MQHLKPGTRRLVAGTAALAVSLGGTAVLAQTAVANPGGTDLVINEVYANGGSAGAAYTHKFIELFNPTNAAITLDGKSLQYRAATSTNPSSGVQVLSGSIPAGGYFTVTAGSNGSNGAAVPGVDLTSSLNLGGGGGTVSLVAGTAAITPGTDATIDRVGWGNSNAPEGTATSGNSVTLSLQRSATGGDTDVNQADFTAAAPTPDAVSGSGPVDPEPETPVVKTIAEIQGTGAATPLEGTLVETTGVVTAAFPTGGLNGFYIQTPGADTPDASDGLFVYRPGFTGVAVGDSVKVTGTATEFSTLTQINATAATASVEVLPTSLGDVVPKTTIPGTDCTLPGTDCLEGAALEAAKEKSEGEVFDLSGTHTVTDVYDGSAYNPPAGGSSNFFGEIGIAANSSIPLVTPTEVIDAQDAAAIADRKRYNNAHRVVLDDGSSTTYWNTANTASGMGTPLPWFGKDTTVRVGATADFKDNVILDYRFGWKVQPTSQVTDSGADKVAFSDTRADNAAPAAVGGNLKLATFNVLNYFTTLGTDMDPGVCTSYNDREGTPIAVNRCASIPNGPRGAWDQTSFERQQAKIVKAINVLDADVVSLEEIENSAAVDGHDRDEALSALVTALNTAAGETRWAFVPSPAASDLPPVADEDVIRTAFIYDPSTTDLVGASKALVGVAAFDNAREPLAQVFKKKGAPADEAFAVIVNHFKSKGSGTDDGTGQGNANPDRVAQAQALAAFSDSFSAERGVSAVFLTGDFNAYSKEDPVQVLESEGFTNLASSDAEEWSYNFEGQVGSLDHVFANAAAQAFVRGVDLWEINANETVFNQYSRFNYNAAVLFDATTPFSASDHNPEIVGLEFSTEEPEPQPVASTIKITAPKKVVVGKKATIKVKVTAAGTTPTGKVTVKVTLKGKTRTFKVTLKNGVATVKVPMRKVGKATVKVTYPGTATVKPSSRATTIKVVKKRR